MQKIVMVEDNLSVFNVFQKGILDFNFLYARNFKDLVYILSNEKIDLILMDKNLEEESGLDISHSIRQNERYKKIPIIMISGDSEEDSISKALNLGIDDYVSKSNSLKLLKAKISANLRRFSNRDTNIEKNEKNIELLEEESSIRFKDTKITLSKKEFLIMKALTENPKKCFSRKELNAASSGCEVHVSDRSIDSFIAYLRNKLKNETMIQTIRGQGYKINLDS